MFSNLVTSLIDYRHEPTTAKANALDMIRCSLEDDLCRAVTLSDPLIKNNSRLFENSTTFLHFLSQLSTIDLIACNHKTSVEEPQFDWDKESLKKQLEECRKQLQASSKIPSIEPLEEEIKSLKRQLANTPEPYVLENLKKRLQDCEGQLHNKTVLVKKMESQLAASETCGKAELEALRMENQQHLGKIHQLQTVEAVQRNRELFLETQIRDFERDLYNTKEEKQQLLKELEQLRREIDDLHPTAVLEPDTEGQPVTKKPSKKRISPNTGRPALQFKDEEMVDLYTEISEANWRQRLQYLMQENEELKLKVSELHESTRKELQRQQEELTQDKLKLRSMFEESAKNFQQAIENERSFNEKRLADKDKQFREKEQQLVDKHWVEKQQLNEKLNAQTENIKELEQLLNDKQKTIDQLLTDKANELQAIAQQLADKNNELADCLNEKANLQKDLPNIRKSYVKRKSRGSEADEYEKEMDKMSNRVAQLVNENNNLKLSIDRLADTHLEEEQKIREEYEAREEQLRNAVREMGRRLGVEDSENIQHIVDKVINFAFTLKSINEEIYNDIKSVADKNQISFVVKTHSYPHKDVIEHLDGYIADLSSSLNAIYQYLMDNVPGVKLVPFQKRRDVILEVVEFLVTMKKPAERMYKCRPVEYGETMVELNRVLVLKYFELMYDYVIVKTAPKTDPTPEISDLINKVKQGESSAYNQFVIAQLTLAYHKPGQTFHESLRINLEGVNPEILDFFHRYELEIKNYIIEYINSKMQQD